MVGKVDDVAAKYKPLKERTVINTLSRCLHEQFPRIGGPRIRALCAEMILETLENNLVHQKRLSHGKIVWNAIAQDDPPRRNRKASDTKTYLAGFGHFFNQGCIAFAVEHGHLIFQSRVEYTLDSG